MCGITGIAYLKSPQPNLSEQIHLATNAIKHRGPDDEGYFMVFADGSTERAKGNDTLLHVELELLPHIKALAGRPASLAMGHRRLSILDLSHKAHQPMQSADKRYTLVYNGEIYNFKQLRAELTGFGYVFTSTSDTEVLLKGWQHWGKNLLHKLDGMWAFAIYDNIANILFLATDPHGVKPLYYNSTDTSFTFASEIKALLTVVPAVLHQCSALDFLVFGKIDHSSDTFFKDIKRLSGGHYLELDLERNTCNLASYYTLEVSDQFEKWNPAVGEKIVQDIRNLLLQSVEKHLIADVPVATTLSGGLDSSTLLGMVSHIRKQNSAPQSSLNVFSIVFPGEANDESRFAKAALHGIDAVWHPISPQTHSFSSDLPAFIQSFEEPVPGINAYAHFVLMQHVQQAGIKVVLDGQGADELFGGYQKHFNALLYTLFAQQQWTTFTDNYLSKNNTFSGSSWLKTALKEKMPWQLQQWIHPMRPFLASSFFKNTKIEQLSGYNVHLGLNKTLYLDSHQGILSFLLKAADHTAMHFSVESRVPFTDDMALSHYVHSLPYNFKIQSGMSKYLLRAAARPFVPDSIYQRKDKLGFSIPTAKWMQNIKQMAIEYINELPAGYLQKDYIIKNYDNFAQSHGYSERLWRVVSFAFWHKAFISGK